MKHYANIALLITLLLFTINCSGSKEAQSDSDSEGPVSVSQTDSSQVEADRILSNNDLIEGKFQFIQGVTAFEQGYYQEALNHLLVATVKLPKKAGVSYSLADTYLKMKDYSNAIYYANEAVNRNPESEWYALKLTEIQRSAGNLEESIKTMEGIVGQHPKNVDYQFKLSMLYADNQQWKRSNEVLQKVINLNGDDPLARRERIQNFAQLGDRQAMINEIEQLRKLEPSNLSLLHNLADQYEEQGQLDKAISVLHDIKDRDPHNSKALIHICDLYVQQQDFDSLASFTNQVFDDQSIRRATHEALLSYLTRTVQDQSNNPQLQQITRRGLDTLTNLYKDSGSIQSAAASYHMAMGNNSDALIALKKTNEIQPGNQQAWLQRLQLLLQDQRYDEVIAVGLQANEYVPQNAFIHYFTAVGFTQTDQHRKAIEWLQKAQDLPARRNFKSVIFTLLGDTHQSVDQWEQAKEAYNQAIQFDPNNATALNNFAYYMSLKGENLNKAEALSKQSLEIEPGNASFLDTYGWILHLRGNHDQALTYLNQSVEAGGASADIFEHLGFVHKALENTDQAITYFQKAIAEDPSLAEKLQPEIDELN